MSAEEDARVHRAQLYAIGKAFEGAAEELADITLDLQLARIELPKGTMQRLANVWGQLANVRAILRGV